MKFINLGSIDIKFLIPVFGGIIYLINNIFINYNPKIEIIVENPFLFNMYIYFGLIFAIILCIGYCIVFGKLMHRKKVEYALLALYFIMIGIGESYTIIIAYNVTLLMLLEVGDKKFDVKTLIQKWRK